MIERDWHAVLHYALDANGACGHCGTRIAGRFDTAFAGRLGRGHLPVRVAVA